MTSYKKKNRCSLFTIVLDPNGQIPIDQACRLNILKSCLRGNGASVRLRGRKPTPQCPPTWERNYCGDIPVKFAQEVDVYVRVNDYTKYFEAKKAGYLPDWV